MKEKLQSMLSRELIMKIALMVFGAIAGIDAKPPEQPADQPAEEK